MADGAVRFTLAARAVADASREWHLSPDDWAATLARHARMGRYGIVVLHFTPGQIRTKPEQVVTDIRAALLAGRPLGVRARPAA